MNLYLALMWNEINQCVLVWWALVNAVFLCCNFYDWNITVNNVWIDYWTRYFVLFSLLAFTAKYGVPTSQWTWLYEALLEVSMTKIALWMLVCTGDWAAESRIKATNAQVYDYRVIDLQVNGSGINNSQVNGFLRYLTLRLGFYSH